MKNTKQILEEEKKKMILDWSWIIVKVFLCLVLISVTFLAFYSLKHSENKCYKGHYEHVSTLPYTSFVQTGKTFVPIFHPGLSNARWICDEHIKEGKKQ